jgi:predicted RNase H-like nuclease
MITVMSKFRLRPDLTPEVAQQEIHETIGWYRGREGCVRKYICMKWDEGYGYGVYLWSDRALAEAFYAEAAAEIERQTGAPPEITFFDTPVIVDNAAGQVIVDGEITETFAPTSATAAPTAP